MKTIVCEEPYRFAMKETDRPEPGEGEALLRIRRIGICGTDLHAYRGRQPFLEYPRILGHELSAVIERIGPNEQGLKEGDLVSVMPYIHCGECIACRNGKTNCCTTLKTLGVHSDGGMREYIALPASLLLRADGLAEEQAAIVECLAIGAHAVRRAAPRPGEFALVIGAGPIGLGVMKFAKLSGARVIALDINEERLEFCRSWAPADFTVRAGEKALEEVAAITGGDLPLTVLDATGNKQSMEQAMQYVASGGVLVYVGLVKADISFHDPEFHRREMTMLSSRNATREDFERVMAAMREGRVDTDRFITHRTGFGGMIGQYDSWLKPETGVIKAVVAVD